MAIKNATAILLSIVATAAIPAPALAAERAQEIVVTGQPLSQTEASLDACLAASCPPEADINATLAHAENQFVAGDYKGARHTLRKSIDRNRVYRSRYPVAVSDLYRANASVLEHMGELTRQRHSIVEMRDTLKDNLPLDDPRALAAELEVGDFRLKTGFPQKAVEKYLAVERDALAANAPQIAVLGRLRYLSWLVRQTLADRHDKLLLRKTKNEIAAFIANPTPGAEKYALVGRILLTRLDRATGDEQSTDDLIAEIVAQGGSHRPVLLYAPQMKLDETRPFLPDKWIDVGFWVSARGRVEEAEVLRSSGTPDWADIVLKSVEKRLYAPAVLADGEQSRFFMVERYTLTAHWVFDTGSRGKVRSRTPRIERLDLTS
jgi:hypothetical protein